MSKNSSAVVISTLTAAAVQVIPGWGIPSESAYTSGRKLYYVPVFSFHWLISGDYPQTIFHQSALQKELNPASLQSLVCNHIIPIPLSADLMNKPCMTSEECRAIIAVYDKEVEDMPDLATLVPPLLYHKNQEGYCNCPELNLDVQDGGRGHFFFFS